MTTIDQFQSLAAAAKAIGAECVSCINVPDDTVLALATADEGIRSKSIYAPDDENDGWTIIDGACCDIGGVWVSVQTARRAATTEEIEEKQGRDLETAALMARIAARETEAA